MGSQVSVDARPGPLSDCFEATEEESQFHYSNANDIPTHHVRKFQKNNNYRRQNDQNRAPNQYYLHQNHVFSCAAISTISHKVKAWSFSNLNYANPQPIPLRADTGCFRPPNIDGNVCFLVLHVSRKDGRSASKGASEVRSFAEQASELITPRGLRIPVGEKS